MANRNYSSYQLVHLTKLRTNGLNSLLVCDGVGVGKTISAGYALYHMSQVERKPSLIVCPPILVEKWRFELKHRFDLTTILATNKDEFGLMSEELDHRTTTNDVPIYITTYSLLSREYKLPKVSLGLTVFDEVHTIRNSETKAYPNAKALAANSEYRLALSATPINNSISDLASILSVILPQLDFDGTNDFLDDYWNSPLMDSISSVVTRFNKEQISDQFTQRNIHTVSLEYPDHYMTWVNKQIEHRSDEYESNSAFRNVVYYRLAASSPGAFCNSISTTSPFTNFDDPKTLALKDLVSSKPDERWLIFTEFKETAKHLEQIIENRLVLALTGDSNREIRDAYTNIFQKEKNSVLIMTPVGSEGLDFQICSNLVNYDLHWNPMKIEQRIGRIDRIGQMKDSIDIYNFLVRGSIDEKVLETINRKMDIISGSFAEIMPIVEPPWEGTFMADQESTIIEITKASELDNATELFLTLTAPDIEIVSSIESVFCNTENWDEMDWSEGVPWADCCRSWSNSNLIQATQLNSILNAYSK